MSSLVLVVDDDPDICLTLARWLARGGYQPLTAADGLTGLRLFHEHHPHLVILDVHLPGLDGWTVAARLREVSTVPLILLTAQGKKEDRLQGFELGADDYVTKPFIPEELVARVGAILKRAGGSAAVTPAATITRGEVAIDLAARRVTRTGKVVRLSPTEFRLLAALAAHPGEPQASRALLAAVWGEAGYRDEDNVRTYIRYLRQKLEDDPQRPRLILTEHGFGYYLA